MQSERISVALCTYNGERFLRTQLESIRDQTRKPDELVISDDGSTDATLSIVADFSKTVSFPVHAYPQETRKGSTKNFEFAIGKCTGDIICLADQDDQWLPEKLEIIERTFQSDRDIGWLFSDGYIADENLEITGERLWERILFTRYEQVQFSIFPTQILLKHNVVTGATLSFKSVYVPWICPIPDDWVHDAWISIMLSLFARCAVLPTPLFQYRQHTSQQLGAGNQGIIKKMQEVKNYSLRFFERQVNCYQELQDRLENLGINGSSFTLVKQKKEHLIARYIIIKKQPGWVEILLKETLSRRYFLYSSGVKSIGRDLLFR